MKRNHLIVTILLLILAALCYIFFDLTKTRVSTDDVINVLLRGVLSRAGLSLLFVWLLYLSGGKKYLIFNKKFFKSMIWSLPLFMVAFINFPYSAFIKNEVRMARSDLIPLFVLYVALISLLEEVVFRGTIFMLMKDWLRNNRHAPFLTTIFCSLIFAVFHFTNLFMGADIVSVLLQVTYTFLIGAMLTVCMLKLGNIWLCVLIHAIFNFGGLLVVNDIAIGDPHDIVFWVLTIVIGVLCAGHVIYSLIKLEKDYVS